LVLLGAALLGLIGTVVIGHDPGFLIGLLLIVGSVVAATGARRAVHQLIPLPALCYIVVTFAAGYLHDQANLTTSKEFYTSFLSWVGSAFFSLAWATILVVVIAFGRWLMSKRLVSWALPAAPSGSGRTASGSAGSGPWGERDSHGAVSPRAVPDPRDTHGTGSFRDSRGSRSPRDPQDPWGQRDSRDNRDSRSSGRGPLGDRAPGGTDVGDPRGDRGRRGDSGSWDGPARQGDAARTGGNRAPHDGRDMRDRQSQRRYGDSRDDDRSYDDRARDNRRPRPADGPRDLW
jgi:hypothetical protein